MSAIFGLVRLDGSRLDEHALEAMRVATSGHGGDGGGLWTGAGIGLGQQLRAVTPEDLCEEQPLVSRDGLRVLVSDGRIDNRPELSPELGLAAAGTVPDSAFILAAYERWGEDCACHLIGPFSFAVWDARLRRLLVACAPFGAKPVFFHQAEGFLAFAPLPSALFAVPGVPRRLCFESLADSLIMVPPAHEASLFQNIHRLEPGHELTVDGRGGVRARAFWAPEPGTLRLGGDEEYVEAFTERFDRAVADHLRSRGPVGVMMSSGLDSTSVAATAAPLLARRGQALAAFTGSPRAGFGPAGPGRLLFDEASLAGTVAAFCANIDLSVIRADGLFLDGLDRFFGAAQMPYEAAANRIWYEAILAEAQHRGIRVLLTGKCGNWTVSWRGAGLVQSLVGSGRWVAAWRETRALNPGSRPPAIAAGLLRVGVKASLPWSARVTIARRRNRDDPLLAADEWWAPLSPINPEFARAQHVVERTTARACDHWQRRGSGTPAARRFRLMDLQRDNGINGGYSALFGVDIRDPTADVRVVEFCLSLPEDQCRRGGVSRWMIRRAMAGRLPAEILAGRQRGIQSADWFERLSAARARVFEELRVLEQSETARTVLDLARMRRLADRMDRPPEDLMDRLFDYSLVLQRGLMMGRFLRWFEHGQAG